MESDVAAPIPWFQPQVGEAELDRIRAVIASNYINDGELARELERKLAARLGVAHCVARDERNRRPGSCSHGSRRWLRR